MWFQQDGATARIARAKMDLLRKILGERIISINAEFVFFQSLNDYIVLMYTSQKSYYIYYTITT